MLCPADWPETSSGVELILRLIAITKVTGKQRHGESSFAVIVELISTRLVYANDTNAMINSRALQLRSFDYVVWPMVIEGDN